jgi:hypothetical protein
MLPERHHRWLMFVCLDVAIAGAVKYYLDEADFRTTRRASVCAR